MKTGIYSMFFAVLVMLALCLGWSVTTLADQLVLYSEAGAGNVRVSQKGPDSGFGEPNLPVVTDKHAAWATINGASWISSSKTIETNGKYGSWRLFTRVFTLPSTAYYHEISATIEIAADNAYAVWCNSIPVGDSNSIGSINGKGSVYDVDTVTYPSGLCPFQITQKHNFEPIASRNKLQILVRNWNLPSGITYENGVNNPTGLLYKVVVNYDAGIPVKIDIKPIVRQNIFDANDLYIIPVEIYGSKTFDIRDIVQSSLECAGLTVCVTDNGQPKCYIKDLNKDGYDDMVCQFVAEIEDWSIEKGKAAVWGSYNDGEMWMNFAGYDEIYLTPPALVK